MTPNTPLKRPFEIPPAIWLTLIIVLATGLRFWQLRDAPPGFYRDEAFNGLDAQGVLNGFTPLYFPANNGREPVFIYLTALSVGLFGPTVWAVRAVATAVGSLTTALVYGLGKRWFGTQTALLTAALWAITVWPVHLSRLGLRVILLVPVLSGAAWLASAAWQDNHPNPWRMRGLWIAAGVVYALSFYTYLAGRFTPLLLAAAACGLLWMGDWRRLRAAVLWGGLGIALGLLPLFVAGLGNPDILLGRPGQVSILNTQINKGDFWGTLWQHSWQSLGLFVWRGDDILRHNPPGRPLFDPFMVIPFLVGMVVMARRWRQPAVWLTVSWVAIMIWPTILAEDAPHFLRAVGILPAALVIPAVGLSEIASWPKLARLWRHLLVALLLCGSLVLTVRDYFFVYNQLPDTGYLFEAAAKTLVDELNTTPLDGVAIVDQRFRDGWPSVPFLLQPQRRVFWIDPPHADWSALPTNQSPINVFVWPFDPAGVEQVQQLVKPPAAVDVQIGPLARGDLEPTPYPLYIHYVIQPSDKRADVSPIASFSVEDLPWRLQLVSADVQRLSNQKLAVNLFWSTDFNAPIDIPLTVFVHVLDPSTGRLIGQGDAQPAAGYWGSSWFQPGVIVQDRHSIDLSQPLNADQHLIFVGLYPTGQPEQRLLMSGRMENPFSSNTVQLSWDNDEHDEP